MTSAAHHLPSISCLLRISAAITSTSSAHVLTLYKVSPDWLTLVLPDSSWLLTSPKQQR